MRKVAVVLMVYCLCTQLAQHSIIGSQECSTWRALVACSTCVQDTVSLMDKDKQAIPSGFTQLKLA